MSEDQHEGVAPGQHYSAFRVRAIVGSIGWASVGFVVGLLLTWFMTILFSPPGGRSIEVARRVSCAGNLSEIGKAIRHYQQEHDGALPGSLSDIVVPMIDEHIFVCPSSGTGASSLRMVAVPVDGHLDYVYLGSAMRRVYAAEGAPSQLPLVFELPANHGQQVDNMLLCDLAVSKAQPQEAERKVNWANACLANARRNGK